VLAQTELVSGHQIAKWPTVPRITPEAILLACPWPPQLIVCQQNDMVTRALPPHHSLVFLEVAKVALAFLGNISAQVGGKTETLYRKLIPAG
jgi:hypothetical protein